MQYTSNGKFVLFNIFSYVDLERAELLCLALLLVTSFTFHIWMSHHTAILQNYKCDLISAVTVIYINLTFHNSCTSGIWATLNLARFSHNSVCRKKTKCLFIKDPFTHHSLPQVVFYNHHRCYTVKLFH